MDKKLNEKEIDKIIEVIPYLDNEAKEKYLYKIIDYINDNMLDSSNLKRIYMLLNYIYNDLVFRTKGISEDEFYNSKLYNKTYKEINNDLIITHNKYIKTLKR